MPSFLNDHNASIYTHNAGVLHLDGPSPSQYDGLSNIDIKVNGHVPPRTIVNSHTSNDSFDGSSSQSSMHTTDTSDAAQESNELNTRTSTMSTSILQNGVSDGEGESITVNGFGHQYASQKHQQQQRPNGTPITRSLPDRSASPLPNGTAERNSSNMSYVEPPSIRTSMASVTSGQPSPVGIPIQQQTQNGDPYNNAANNIAPGFRATSPATQRSGLDPNAPPQRFSSPAQMSGNTGFSASTSNLHPTSAGLKHRHTLEVPRPGQPRGSKDGMDSALASGRFSPTGSSPGGGGARRASLSLVRRNTRSMHSDFPRDEAYPDEDAMRWAEAYRQKRASKRKKKEEEDDDRVLIGNKVDEKHANWVTAYNMLTGIRVAVSRTNAKLDRPLTDADFEAKQKSTFDM